MPYENDAKISIEHVPATGDIRYEIDVGDKPVDIIFSFTNVREVGGADVPDVEESSIEINGFSFPAPVPHVMEVPEKNRSPLRVFLEESTRDVLSSTGPAELSKNTLPVIGLPHFDKVSDTDTFTGVDEEGSIQYDTATCRYVSDGPVDTGQGERTLNIWVADNCWGGESEDVTNVTNEMITELAGKFLQAGSDNDIYDWVTGILGPEWGEHSYDSLIPFTKEITILLCDIGDDTDPNSAAVGYFWPVHNFIASSKTDSNERVMFVLDAVIYADPYNTLDDNDTTWEPTDYWPKVVFSTLAHEFQHMIHFYQKRVLRTGLNTATETWINEMCSLLTEDFLSDKIGVEGPRGVDPEEPTAGDSDNVYGRLPTFNEYLFRPVIVDYPQSFVLEDYSVAYAFGAYLARNYGGVDFLNRVVCSSYTDKEAIEYAVREYTDGEETFERLLERWGGAIFLSDKITAPEMYRYNCGTWFVSNIDAGTAYNLGSINLYNYNPSPQYAESASQLSHGLDSPGSNVYLLAAEDALGKYSWDITIPEDVRLTVIFKGQ